MRRGGTKKRKRGRGVVTRFKVHWAGSGLSLCRSQQRQKNKGLRFLALGFFGGGCVTNPRHFLISSGPVGKMIMISTKEAPKTGDRVCSPQWSLCRPRTLVVREGKPDWGEKKLATYKSAEGFAGA